MSRWIIITADTLKAAGHGAIVDRARTLAVGGEDPVDEALMNAVARVRRAVSTGNVLDADPDKVPISLKDVAVRRALFALISRIGLPLDKDQENAQREDNIDLRSIEKNKTKVDLPDNAATSDTMQSTGLKISAVGVPPRQTGRDRTSGL